MQVQHGDRSGSENQEEENSSESEKVEEDDEKSNSWSECEDDNDCGVLCEYAFIKCHLLMFPHINIYIHIHTHTEMASEGQTQKAAPMLDVETLACAIR